MSEYPNTLKEDLRDEEYRYAYAEDFLNTLIATQIKVLREQRGMTQAGLANAIGTKQAGISRLENVNYNAWKTETLRRIAHALKVRLRITFETFGTLLDDAGSFSRQSLQRPDFENDPVFNNTLSPAVVSIPAEQDLALKNITVTYRTPRHGAYIDYVDASPFLNIDYFNASTPSVYQQHLGNAPAFQENIALPGFAALGHPSAFSYLWGCEPLGATPTQEFRGKKTLGEETQRAA